MSFLPAGFSDEDNSDDGFDDEPRWRNRPVLNDNAVQNVGINKEILVSNAAASGDLDTLISILENGCNINIDLCLNGSWTALMQACYHLQFDVMSYLLDSGANPNAHCDSVTALSRLCCYNGDDEDTQLRCLRLLIEKGATINMGDKFGLTPLMKLTEFGHLHVMEELIQLGANIEMRDSQGWTVIFWAVHYGNLNMVTSLAEKNARLNELDKRGRGLIDLAPTEFHQPIVHYLKSLEKADEVDIEPHALLLENRIWDDYFPRMTPSDNKPEYTAEIPYLLYGMHCERLIPLFTNAKLSLRDFLLLDEEGMRKMGVDLPYERNRIKMGLLKYHQAKWELASVAGLTAAKRRKFDPMESMNTLGSHLRQLYILECSIEYAMRKLPKPGDTKVDNDLIKARNELSSNLQGLKREMKVVKMDLLKMQAQNPPPADLVKPSQNESCNFCSRVRIMLFTGIVIGSGVAIANHITMSK